MEKLTSLESFLTGPQTFDADGTATRTLLGALSEAAARVSRDVSRAGLMGLFGATATTNVQGEIVQKLDSLADQTFLEALRGTGLVAAVASEENAEVIRFDSPAAPYAVAIDPLDGSSNIDVNVSIGTIFAVWERLSDPAGPATVADVLQPGNQQLAAGYFIYGSSTMLVLTVGQGTHGFTLDPDSGAFYLSHPGIRIPEKCTCFSLNERDYAEWAPQLQAYVDAVREQNANPATCFTPRYIGSMVADVHRNLLKGGIFIYPGTRTKPNGKLRLQYEANPMGLIVAQAGGYASNGRESILDLTPTSPHERTPVFMGNTGEVQRAERFLKRTLITTQA